MFLDDWLLPVMVEDLKFGQHRYVGRFPPQLVRALLNHFQAGPEDLVLDPFVGSGTTLVVAERLNRNSIGIEIDEGYFKAMTERLADKGL
jgi:DNA modification methylase